MNTEELRDRIREAVATQGSTLYLDAAQVEVAQWHTKMFPDFYNLPERRQIELLLLKLAEETGETIKAFQKNEPQINVCHESMNTIIVCLQILERLSQSAESVFDSVMYKNKKRLVLHF